MVNILVYSIIILRVKDLLAFFVGGHGYFLKKIKKSPVSIAGKQIKNAAKEAGIWYLLPNSIMAKLQQNQLNIAVIMIAPSLIAGFGMS